MSKLNYQYYKLRFRELLKQYEGKFVVIKNESIIGAYDSFNQAYETTIKKESPGTFIIQHCVENKGSDMMYFASNNVEFTGV